MSSNIIIVLSSSTPTPDFAEIFNLSESSFFKSILFSTTIVGIDGKDVVRIEDILSQIERHNVGDTIQLIVIREGSEVTFTLTLGERP